MNKHLIIIGLVLLLGIGFLVWNRQLPPGGAMDESPVVSVPQQDSSDGGPSAQRTRYQEYDPDEFSQPGGNKRVLFFHAPWCPTCKGANEEFEKNASAIPEDIVVYKTDYDTNPELKKKYGITYQHTFVLVDEEGNAVKKWNGGGVKELAANVK